VLTPTDPSAGAPAVASVPAQSFTTTPQTSPAGGTYYSVNGETLIENGYPITPKTTLDVTSTRPGFMARGATIESLTTSATGNVLPAIARSTIDRVSTEASTRPSTVVFPTSFQSVAGTTQRQKLVVYPGQFSDNDPAPGADRGTETLLTNGSFNVYYATTNTVNGVDPTAGDTTPPFIQSSTATGSAAPGGSTVVLFQVVASDPFNTNDTVATNIKRVFVQYDDQPNSTTPHTWLKVELQPDSKGVYVGAVTANANGRYLVQVVDGAGNVAVSQFKGNYYDAQGAVAPQAVATVITQGTISTTGWYTSADTKVALFVNGNPVADGGYSFSTDGGLHNLSYTGPFTAPEGTNTVTFSPAVGSNLPKPPDLVVSKDTIAPAVTLDTPVSVITDTESVTPTLCKATDPVPGSGVDANGCVVTPVDVPLAGKTYTLGRGTATDVAGNSATAGQTAVILSGATREGPLQFSAPDAVTIIAAGQQYAGVTFTDPAGALLPSIIDNQAQTNTLSIPHPGSYPVTVNVPGLKALTFTIAVVDTPPILTLPASAGPVEATGTDGAVVTWTGVSAVDVQDGNITPICTPASGSTFPLGTTTVTCSATDSGNNLVSGSFPVNVVDTTAPSVTVPGPVTAEATGAAGAIVNYPPVTASDIADATPVVSCDSGSGTVFPLGTTTVTCTATDHSGNHSSASFTVTVSDTTPPVLTVPASTTVEGNTIGGATFSYMSTANDLVNGSVAVTCNPASGSLFPLGTTTVICSAIDAAQNSASKSFTVTVVDTTAPKVTVPADITVKSNNYKGTPVTWTGVSATDIVAGSLPVTCAPASGSTFNFGATLVTCSASDPSGNKGTATFKVTVVVMYRYDGDDLPIHEGSYDTYGLNRHVNSEPGGRYVLFKWKAYDNLTGAQLVDPTKVEVYFEPYSTFVARWGKPSQIPSKTALPAGNVCSDGTRTTFALGVTTMGSSTPIKFVNGEFNAGFKLPAKPSAANNCFVQWSRIIGDPTPGIVSLFVLS
jgi:hypothetical protein